jgi:hypothetical protein
MDTGWDFAEKKSKGIEAFPLILEPTAKLRIK